MILRDHRIPATRRAAPTSSPGASPNDRRFLLVLPRAPVKVPPARASIAIAADGSRSWRIPRWSTPRAQFVDLGQPVLDDGAALFFGGEGELSTTLVRVDHRGVHALYSGAADVQFDNGTTRTISVGESGVRPMAISNHLLAISTLLPHEAHAPAVVLLDVGIAGTDGSGEPPHDAGTTTTTTTTKPGEGCNGGPKAALAPVGLFVAVLAASRRRQGSRSGAESRSRSEGR